MCSSIHFIFVFDNKLFVFTGYFPAVFPIVLFCLCALFRTLLFSLYFITVAMRCFTIRIWIGRYSIFFLFFFAAPLKNQQQCTERKINLERFHSLFLFAFVLCWHCYFLLFFGRNSRLHWVYMRVLSAVYNPTLHAISILNTCYI